MSVSQWSFAGIKREGGGLEDDLGASEGEGAIEFGKTDVVADG